MSRDQGPRNCCDYGCDQGRNCPGRIARVIATKTRWFDRRPSADSLTALLAWLALTVFFASLALSAGIFLGA